MRPAALIGLASLCLAGPALAGSSGPTILYFPGTPVLPTHAARPDLTDEQRRELQLKPLVAEGAPLATAGPLKEGGAFLQTRVRHAITGKLTAQVKTQGLFSGGQTLPAGQAVYGVPMGGPDGPGLVWCAPRKGQGAGKWSTICLPFGDAKHVWVKATPAMFPLALSWFDAGGTNTNPPLVERGPVELPPMTLSYAFGGVNARGWLVVDCRLDWGEGPALLRSVALPPDATGRVRLKLLGGEIALIRTAEGAEAQVLTPPEAGREIVF